MEYVTKISFKVYGKDYKTMFYGCGTYMASQGISSVVTIGSTFIVEDMIRYV